jgi:predicted RNase H-like HicB family nuclease
MGTLIAIHVIFNEATAMAYNDIQIHFKLPYRYKKAGKWIVASCPPLDVHSQGKTEVQAKKNLIEALSLFLESCHERGTLDAVLKECGFAKVAFPVKVRISKTDYVEVPLQLVANA